MQILSILCKSFARNDHHTARQSNINFFRLSKCTKHNFKNLSRLSYKLLKRKDKGQILGYNNKSRWFPTFPIEMSCEMVTLSPAANHYCCPFQKTYEPRSTYCSRLHCMLDSLAFSLLCFAAGDSCRAVLAFTKIRICRKGNYQSVTK